MEIISRVFTMTDVSFMRGYDRATTALSKHLMIRFQSSREAK